MEFLDSLDLDTIDKKSRRVRSWYLYEQFKSLEKSQLDAAQKLKDRSYQERILRQELSERRARRKLYDQFGLCQSESRLKRDKSASIYRTTASTSDDDFFESFFLLHEDEQVTKVTGGNDFSGEGEGETFSQEGLSASQCCLQNHVGVEEHNKDDNCSYAASVTSVVENLKPPNDELIQSQKMEYMENSIDDDAKDSVADDINQQLDFVKENILCLENIAKLEDVDKISEEDIFNKSSVQGTEPDRSLRHDTVSKKPDQEYNVIAIWSRLVSFAYQVVQLNHGNCYCDYSSQFLTAVLACDVLRRGVNRMCHILQPYVSPIEFASDESDVSNSSANSNVKRKKSVQFRKYRKICEIKPLSRNRKKKLVKTRRSERVSAGRRCLQKYWKPIYTQSLANDDTPARLFLVTEPWLSSTRIYHFTEEISPRTSSSSTIWSDFLKDKPKLTRRHSYNYRNKALHPMLKIAQCIDSILKDIDDSMHDM